VLQAIQALNKQTFALEAIKTFSTLTNATAKAKLALIEITAAETLKELAPEIAAVKPTRRTSTNPVTTSAGIRLGPRAAKALMCGLA
jgi:hypothetical protein